MVALGAAASRGHKTYLLGSDVLGAELAPVPSTPITEYIQPTQYRTQVAAGLTVIAAWALISHLKLRK
jgi:hypothetical protein